MYAQWKNDAFSTLAGALGAADTSLAVQAGQGDRFPVITAPNTMTLTLQDSAGNIERIKVTARAGVSDVMTIVRAQEGTTARSWAIGTPVRLQLTAEFVGSLVTKDDPETLTNKTLTGCVADTPTAGDADTSIATTAFVAQAIAAAVAAANQAMHPVGSIYINKTNGTNPATLLGFGTWVALAGRTIVGLDPADPLFNTAGATGGSKDAIAVAHTHTFSATTGGQSATHSHGVTDPGHAHTGGVTQNASVVGGANPIQTGTVATGSSTTGITLGNASNDHTHGVSGTTGSTGAAGTNANLPPYLVGYMWERTA